MSEKEQKPTGRAPWTTLSFHPAYLAREFGADFGEAYHRDPMARAAIGRAVAKKLYERYGEYGLGNPDPKPSVSMAIQPLDFLNVALGGRLVYQREESAWTPDKPLERVETLDDLNALKDVDWERCALLNDYWRQIETLKAAFPDCPVGNVQGVARLNDKEALAVMHTPYTTAFRLMGERIFEWMLLEEDLARGILEYLSRQYLNLWEHIRAKLGLTLTKIHLGDCAATMLSPDLYEKYSLPIYRRYMERFQSCVIHSCGPSGHLLEKFAAVPAVGELQLGDDTDLRTTRKNFPEARVMAYFSPVTLLGSNPDAIERKAFAMAEALGDRFVVSCTSVDPDTPTENIERFLKIGQAA